MKSVLFLCTGNSCRSQMAEAVVNARLARSWHASSAGTAPAGYIHPKVLQVLNEIGIHHDGKSKHVDRFRGVSFDLVVTVCDSAAEECPIWIGRGIRMHQSFRDPANVDGTEDQILAVFRQVRDEIAVEIPRLLEERFLT